jgi:hypothetical protein
VYGGTVAHKTVDPLVLGANLTITLTSRGVCGLAGLNGARLLTEVTLANNCEIDAECDDLMGAFSDRRRKGVEGTLYPVNI